MSNRVTINFRGGTIVTEAGDVKSSEFSSTWEHAAEMPGVPRTNDRVVVDLGDGKFLRGWVGRVEWHEHSITVGLGADN